MSLTVLGERHVGWTDGANVVASAHMEREGDDAVIASIEYDDLDSARELVDAIVGAATYARIVGTNHVLGQCGFAREGERWSRDVEVVAAPDELTRAVTLGQLEDAIRASWSAETSDDPESWTSDNPAFQQCAATAHVVRDYLGGEVIVAGVILNGRRVDRHAWNRLSSGFTVDLTREQFRAGERLEEPAATELFDVGRHLECYELLASRVRARLSNS